MRRLPRRTLTKSSRLKSHSGRASKPRGFWKRAQNDPRLVFEIDKRFLEHFLRNSGAQLFTVRDFPTFESETCRKMKRFLPTFASERSTNFFRLSRLSNRQQHPVQNFERRAPTGKSCRKHWPKTLLKVFDRIFLSKTLAKVFDRISLSKTFVSIWQISRSAVFC